MSYWWHHTKQEKSSQNHRKDGRSRAFYRPGEKKNAIKTNLHSQSSILRQSFGDCFNIHRTNISQGLDIVYVFGNELAFIYSACFQVTGVVLPTWMQIETRVGDLFSSKVVMFLLSAGAFRFFGEGFLKGSLPPAFAHWWHRKPSPEFAAKVYLV